MTSQENEVDRLKAALADRYTIQGEVGAGGMATMYLATDLRHQRKVALKVLRSDLAASLGAERFLQEVRVTANLQHPQILPLFDSGEAHGFLFYVMPFIEGESPRNRLSRERELPVPEAARLLRDVVDALAAAHRMGVVHRDIKPETILISGRHAVGAMAYELLAGRPPFHGRTAQQILTAKVMEDPQPVSELRASVPQALEPLVMRALEKKPADRWRSAAGEPNGLFSRHRILTSLNGRIHDNQSSSQVAHSLRYRSPTGSLRRAGAAGGSRGRRSPG